ncbi:MAG: type II toxin-antitoxin system HigB family toxin [Prolixibacteraceae bacterium]|nr:type II toxin-antitoxin system HigB family toxin [Prolixibacteraceae bacterium]
MRIISSKVFREFAMKHPDCGKQLNLLKKDLEKKSFENSNQVKDYFPYISILKDNRVVFNIHGNEYRLVIKFNFNSKIAFVRFLGTHTDYDKIDANSI